MFKIEVYSDYPLTTDTESIFNLIHSQMASNGSSKSVEQIKQAISNAFRPESRAVLFIGYVGNDVPVAFAFGNVCAGLESGGDYFWLNEFFVDMSFRRHGYANRLLSFIKNWLTDKEIKYLACVTGEKNMAAQNMYEKSGFELSRLIWVDKQV